MAQSMQPAFPRPAHTDLLTIRDGTNSHEDPAVSTERNLVENISNTPGKAIDILGGSSTVAEEPGEDVEPKFWAMYEEVANEYNNDFLEQANDDLTLILTFASLFCAVNSFFIFGMQPDPGDAINVLMVQLIKVITKSSHAVDSDLSITYSSTIWMQALVYASLFFSVLAAFGAVIGKQWLNSYKAARGQRSLEERGMQRQMKSGGLEYRQLQTVSNTFLVLLQISLFLFGLSLSAAYEPNE